MNITVAQEVHVFFDGVEEDLREPAILRGGRTLLGLRKTFDRLGAVVYFDSSTKQITAWRGERTILIQIDRPEAMIDGRTITMDQPPIIVGRSTYVPLRFLSEALGAEVKYVSSSNSAYIVTKTMNFFNEKAPFKVGDTVHYLYRRRWSPATVLEVTDHPDKEDQYLIEFREPSGRVIKLHVGRRYVRIPLGGVTMAAKPDSDPLAKESSCALRLYPRWRPVRIPYLHPNIPYCRARGRVRAAGIFIPHYVAQRNVERPSLKCARFRASIV